LLPAGLPDVTPQHPATHSTVPFLYWFLLLQYYFETIFPRIPKTVEGDIITDLKARGLPTSGKGNGGAGGPDRRGLDEGNKRPASVKASLSVAFGQRAPNRAGARDDRVREALRQQADKGGGSREGGGSKQQQVRSRSRSPGRNRGSSRDGAPGGYRNGSDYRDRGRDDRYGGRSTQPPRSRSRSRDRGRDDPRANGRGSSRDGYDRRDDYGSRYDRQQQRGGGYRSRSRSPGGYRGGGRRSSRSRSRERGGGGGRSAAEVFGGGAAAFGRPKTDVFSKYADAGGGAGGGASAAAKFGTGEVLRLGPKKPVVFSGKY
jgi:pre-mRNA-splicing factor 38B